MLGVHRGPRGKGTGPLLWSFEEWIRVFLGSGSCRHLFLPNLLPCPVFGLFTRLLFHLRRLASYSWHWISWTTLSFWNPALIQAVQQNGVVESITGQASMLPTFTWITFVGLSCFSAVKLSLSAKKGLMGKLCWDGGSQSTKTLLPVLWNRQGIHAISTWLVTMTFTLISRRCRFFLGCSDCFFSFCVASSHVIELLSDCFTTFVLSEWVCVSESEENQSGLPVHTTECLWRVFSWVCIFSTFFQDRRKNRYNIWSVIKMISAFIYWKSM